MKFFQSLDVKKKEKEKCNALTIKEMIKSISSIHEVCKIPNNLKKVITGMIFWSICISVSTTLLSFLLELSREFIVAGNIVGWLMFVIYHLKDILISLFRSFSEKNSNTFSKYLNLNNNQIGCTVLEKVNGKVRIDGKTYNSALILDILSGYFDKLYRVRSEFARTLISIIVTIISFIGTIVVLYSGKGLNLFSISITVIIFISLVLFILLELDLQRKIKSVKDKHYDYWKKIQESKNDLKNIQSINRKHFWFMSKKYIENVYQNDEYRENDIKMYRNNTILKDVISCSSMILTLILYIGNLGWNFTLNTFVEILAFQTIFASLLSAEVQIARLMTNFSETVMDEQIARKEFSLIMQVYDNEIEKNLRANNGNYIVIEPYHYLSENFELILKSKIVLEKGKMILLNGKSGTGKSTLIDIITGNKGNVGYNIKAIKYHNGMELGSDSILNEILLGEEIDYLRFVKILKGTQIYDNLETKAQKANQTLIEYLSTIQRDSLSDGIEQRLLISRILYHLDDSIDLLLFDEPISAIDKNTAINVIDFIKEYCNKDKKRYVLLATHQYEWLGSYIDEQIEFKQISQVKSVIE